MSIETENCILKKHIKSKKRFEKWFVKNNQADETAYVKYS